MLSPRGLLDDLGLQDRSGDVDPPLGRQPWASADGRDPMPPDVRCLAAWFDRQVYGIEIEFA